MVVAGVAAMLAPHPERVAVVELDSQLPVLSDVDVILYDTFGQVQGDGVDLDELVDGGAARVVIFSWNTQPDLVQRALAQGRGRLPVQGDDGRGDRRRARGDPRAASVVTPDFVDTDGRSANGEWPGRDVGLTAREAEVLALITQGLSNQEIAERSYLSINSVKTYIRTAYRKIGVTRRAQAVRVGHAARLRAGPGRRVGDAAVTG